MTAPSAADALGDGADLRAFLGDLGHPAKRIATPYSPEYLAWRYARAPLGYRAIVARTASRIDGIAIFRVRPRGRLWETTIAELLVRPDGSAQPRISSIEWPHRHRSITSRATSPPARPTRRGTAAAVPPIAER